MKRLADIINKPRLHDGVHESIYRSYDTLEYVLAMVERGDSSDTILEVAKFLQEYGK